ncbi:hypothetical protein L6452_38524 [Arctium lappa]|uniref:Uncharacterized protein n=1 Tax=Arctium lappa TaxID=4217 RepID=A0ACB8XQI6_ARCLA|nr:hypothetical protein L6452_38524 [Arctium lappa]
MQLPTEGRPKWKTTKKATTQVNEPAAGTRGGRATRIVRRARSVEARPGQETSLQESSASVRGRRQARNRGGEQTQGFVMQETFAVEMGKLQETMNALLAQRTTEVSATVVERGCSFKEFTACIPPTYKGECDHVLAMKWVKGLELAFDTSKCSEGIREPATFQAAVNAAELREKEKNRQATKRSGRERFVIPDHSNPLNLISGLLPRMRISRAANCGSPDHIRTDCSQLKKGAAGGYGDKGGEKKVEPARARARDFNMTAEEAVETPDVVTGTFPIDSIFAKVLFDSGANRSFVSPNFVHKLLVKPKKLSQWFEVEVTDDSRVLVGEVYDGCSIDIDGHTFPLRLYPMGMGEFDVIVGMDWLASNDANIVCNKKLIRIALPDKKEVIVYGDRRDRKS